MIKLTKLNGEEFILNAELIQFVEQRPDTYITLTNSERFIVKEPMTEVIKGASPIAACCTNWRQPGKRYRLSNHRILTTTFQSPD